ncbi:MAG: ABC transporter permease subunit [Nitrososphaerales archaeon]
MRKIAVFLQIGTIAAVIVIWEEIVVKGFVDPLFLPPPSQVLYSFATLPALIGLPFYETLTKTLLSFAVGSGLGIALGILIGSGIFLHDVLYPYIFGLYSIPRMIFLPLIVLFLGIGFNSTLFYAVLHTVLPVIIIVIGGVRAVDKRLILYAVSVGATLTQIYTKVIIPAALPSIIAALRLGIIFSLLGVLIAEMYLSLSGIGFLMQKLSFAFRSADLFAVTICVAVIAIVISVLLGEFQKKIGERQI